MAFKSWSMTDSYDDLVEVEVDHGAVFVRVHSNGDESVAIFNASPKKVKRLRRLLKKALRAMEEGS